MKRLFITSLLFLSVGLSQKLYEVIETYENGNIESITYHKKIRDSIVKVKVEGYHYTGQKKSEGTYKNKELDGLYTEWYRNGQKKSEETFKDGNLDGLYTEWYENGQKKSETTYNYGGEDGLHTGWYENGQKKEEINYTDGEKMGLGTGWYSNGQKEFERTYVDGLFLPEKEWTEDGLLIRY